MIKLIFDLIFKRKKQNSSKAVNPSIVTEEMKKQIDKIWNNIDKMSGYGITIICMDTQEDDLAIALAHSADFIVERFNNYLKLNSKFSVIKLINKYKTTISEDDGYHMKSHIINLHEERFRKEKLIL